MSIAKRPAVRALVAGLSIAALSAFADDDHIALLKNVTGHVHV